jgi:spore coat protein H
MIGCVNGAAVPERPAADLPGPVSCGPWLRRSRVGAGAWAVAVGLTALGTAAWASAARAELVGTELFERGWVPDIVVELGAAEQAALRAAPRSYVPATLRQGTSLWHQVGVHLKGRTSFRPLEDRPSLTVSFDRFVPGQRFYGLAKIHLHNAADDPTLLNEWLGAELFRAAGIPATRVGLARVGLSRRQLGLYVLKEGFTPDFLAAHFPPPQGNLYEPVQGNDIDGQMELVVGRVTDAGATDIEHGLRALAQAALDPDPDRRWPRLESVLDLDRFLTFMALEVLLGHRDGYCIARNNYRVYQPPSPGKTVFLPHGMDVLLGNPDLPVQPQMAGLVARAVVETPQGRDQYRERLNFLLTNLLRADWIATRIDQRLAALRPSLTRAEARHLAQGAAVVKQRLAARAAAVARQLAEPEPALLQFEHGVARLGPWRPVDPPAGGHLDQVKTADGRQALYVRAGPRTATSWRTRVRLPQGRYRFEGRVQLAGVVPLPYGRNQGAGLRVIGIGRLPPYNFTGSSAWKMLSLEFSVTQPVTELELACELRAAAGEAWFELESLRLVWLP